MAFTAQSAERAAKGMASLVWAYMAALTRGESSRSSMILQVFVESFPTYRSALVLGYSAAVRPRVEELLPARLPFMYGAEIALAFQASLKTGWLGPAEDGGFLDSMPTKPSQLPAYFQSQLATRSPQSVGNAVWELDVLTRAVPEARLAEALRNALRAIAAGQSWSAATVLPAASAAPAPTPSAPSTSPRPISLPEETIIGNRAAAPAWQSWLLGIGALAGGLLGIYWLYQAQKRSR